jgi:isochorismate pyruvate lyase
LILARGMGRAFVHNDLDASQTEIFLSAGTSQLGTSPQESHTSPTQIESEKMIEPDHCQSITEVRAGVDALDEQIVALLGKRMRFMEAAARIKQSRHEVRDEARKAAVITHAREVAERVFFPPALVSTIYELLVEGSIAYEEEVFEMRN